MFCPMCGSSLPDTASFCTSCGKQLGSVTNQSVAELNYSIFGDNLPAVSIKLNRGESIFTQSGGMAWMDNNITMTTNMQGGLMKGIGRMFSGESLFMATY